MSHWAPRRRGRRRGSTTGWRRLLPGARRARAVWLHGPVALHQPGCTWRRTSESAHAMMALVEFRDPHQPPTPPNPARQRQPDTNTANTADPPQQTSDQSTDTADDCPGAGRDTAVITTGPIMEGRAVPLTNLGPDPPRARHLRRRQGTVQLQTPHDASRMAVHPALLNAASPAGAPRPARPSTRCRSPRQ